MAIEKQIKVRTNVELDRALRKLEKNSFSLADNGAIGNEPQEILVGGEGTGLRVGKRGVKIDGELDVADGTLHIVTDSDGVQHKGIDGTGADTTVTAVNNLYTDKKTISTKNTPTKNNHLVTKEYADSVGGGDGSEATTFQLEDGDGTEVTISHEKEVKFVEGSNIDINWTDTSTGSDGDPYDMTFTVNIPYILYASFQDDVGTARHYLPLRGYAEQAFIGNEPAGTIAPFNMTLQKVVMRSNTDLSGADWKLGMWAIDSGTTEAHHHTTGMNWKEVTGGAQFTNCTWDFTTGDIGNGSGTSGGSNAVTAGQWIDFQLLADTDVTSSSSEFWFTFLFHADMTNTI